MNTTTLSAGMREADLKLSMNELGAGADFSFEQATRSTDGAISIESSPIALLSRFINVHPSVLWSGSRAIAGTEPLAGSLGG